MVTGNALLVVSLCRQIKLNLTTLHKCLILLLGTIRATIEPIIVQIARIEGPITRPATIGLEASRERITEAIIIEIPAIIEAGIKVGIEQIPLMAMAIETKAVIDEATIEAKVVIDNLTIIITGMKIIAIIVATEGEAPLDLETAMAMATQDLRRPILRSP